MSGAASAQAAQSERLNHLDMRVSPFVVCLVVAVGANGKINTITATAFVDAIVLTNAGLKQHVSIFSGGTISRVKI